MVNMKSLVLVQGQLCGRRLRSVRVVLAADSLVRRVKPSTLCFCEKEQETVFSSFMTIRIFKKYI